MDIFTPPEITKKKAIFIVHGGGWTGGSKSGYHQIMQALCNEGFVCASVDYRLSGVTALEQLADCRHGYDCFVSHLKKQGHKTGIVCHGSSAGAHLAALMVLVQPGGCGENVSACGYTMQNDWITPSALIVQAFPLTFEIWDDVFPPIWQAMCAITGSPYEKKSDLYRLLSPIHHVSCKTPPVFNMIAEFEHMFPDELNEQFKLKMRTAGCRYESRIYTKAEHGFFYDVTRRQQKEAFQDMLKFIDSLT